jgi:hypothetical protein
MKCAAQRSCRRQLMCGVSAASSAASALLGSRWAHASHTHMHGGVACCLRVCMDGLRAQ